MPKNKKYIMRIRALLLLLSAFIMRGDLLAQDSASSTHEASKGAGVTTFAVNKVVASRTVCKEGRAGVFPCNNIDLLSFLPIGEIGGGPGTRLNDIWGWTDPDTGREYALVGRTDGTVFVDVTDPENPVHVGSLPSVEGAVSGWRDIKTMGNFALVVMDFPPDSIRHGIQVFDLTRLRNVSNPPRTLEESTRYTEFARAHNIVTNEETEYAYAVGTETCGGGLHMVNFREPLNPQFAGCYGNSGYTHDAQCVLYEGPDPEYQGREICIASNASHVLIADVTDKTAVVPISTTTYPSVQYTHQAWLTRDQRYLLVDDELDELRDSNLTRTRTLIFDVEELDDPQLISEYVGVTTSTDHNQYVRRNRAFQANYTSGLRVLDVSDIINTKEVGFFDTYPEDDRPGFRGAWSNYPFFESGVVVVSSINEGLFVLEPTGPAATDAAKVELPEKFALLSAYPNPFSLETTIRVEVERPQHVRVAVFDVQGRELAVLHDRFIEAGGIQEVTFGAGDLASGVYVVRADGGGTGVSITITLQK